MPSASRGIVWSLLTAIIILLLGIVGLLYVSYNRDKRYESEIKNLRLELTDKNAQIERLQSPVRNQVNTPDTSWGVRPDTSFR